MRHYRHPVYYQGKEYPTVENCAEKNHVSKACVYRWLVLGYAHWGIKGNTIAKPNHSIAYYWIDEQEQRHDFISQKEAGRFLGLHHTSIHYRNKHNIHSLQDLKIHRDKRKSEKRRELGIGG